MYRWVRKLLLVTVIAPLAANIAGASLKLLYMHSYLVGGLLGLAAGGIFVYVMEQLEIKQ